MKKVEEIPEVAPKKSYKKRAAIGVSSLLVIGLIIFGIYWMMKKRQAEDDEAEDSATTPLISDVGKTMEIEKINRGMILRAKTEGVAVRPSMSTPGASVPGALAVDGYYDDDASEAKVSQEVINAAITAYTSSAANLAADCANACRQAFSRRPIKRRRCEANC